MSLPPKFWRCLKSMLNRNLKQIAPVVFHRLLTNQLCETNDFVITKSHAGEKTLLQGITFVFVRFLPISDYFKCYTCLAIEILSYHLECCQTFWVCCILWNFPQLVDNIFFYHFQCIFSGSISFPWFRVCFPLFIG